MKHFFPKFDFVLETLNITSHKSLFTTCKSFNRFFVKSAMCASVEMRGCMKEGGGEVEGVQLANDLMPRAL